MSIRVFLTFTSADDLRAHMDRLNDQGESSNVAGVDANDIPFIAQLIGPYAETTAVMTNSPWDGEVGLDMMDPCPECAVGPENRTIESLAYPLQIFGRSSM